MVKALIGLFLGVNALIVYCCCRAASAADRWEEACWEPVEEKRPENTPKQPQP